MHTLHRIIFVTILFGIFSAWSQENESNDLGDLSLDDLLTLVVNTGSFLDLDLQKSPMAMTIIKKDQINLSGARSLTELLEIYVPGFQYSINPWNGIQWGMRGVSNDRNTKFLVLVNGHKINSESKDGFIAETDLGLLGDFERVEVLRGPAGLVYGSGAIAGIVNIVTRTETDNRSEFSMGFGTQGSFDYTSKIYDVRMYGVPHPDQRFAATFGWKESEGEGDGRTRLYGLGMWPFNAGSGVAKPNGVPTDGSWGMTPGNWRASVDYQWKHLSVYARATHQYMSNGGFFTIDLWPQFQGPTNESWMPTSPARAAEQIDSLLGVLKADSTSNAAQITLLETMKQQLPNLPSVNVDGVYISPYDTFWQNTEGWGNQRHAYIADNVTMGINYEQAIGNNKLRYELAFDGVTNRMQMEARQGYEALSASERGWAGVVSTFGERRYTLGATMLWMDIPHTQLATGLNQRFDDFGEDLQGRNYAYGNPKRPAIANILYSNTALFMEGYSDILHSLGLDYGIRWDGHTRTMKYGGTFNGKLATIYTPIPNHTFKLIAQTSSNNGTVDNYEHNANHYNDDGVEQNSAFFADPTDTASATYYHNIVSTKELHKLRPERAYSFELTSTHSLFGKLFFSPSVSYNIVKDMFAWCQLYRVINSGEYRHLDVDMEAVLNLSSITLGINHSMQVPVNTKLSDLDDTLIYYSSIDTSLPNWYKVSGTDKNGNTTYIPTPNVLDTAVINPIRDAIIGEDGKHFRGLVTHISKAYVDIRPLDWITLHSDVRVFWGFWGRKTEYDRQDSLGYQTWDIQDNPMVKLDASIHFALPNHLQVSVFAYDILGLDDPTDPTDDWATLNTLRWANGAANDLYAADLRSYAIRIDKSF